LHKVVQLFPGILVIAAIDKLSQRFDTGDDLSDLVRETLIGVCRLENSDKAVIAGCDGALAGEEKKTERKKRQEPVALPETDQDTLYV